MGRPSDLQWKCRASPTQGLGDGHKTSSAISVPNTVSMVGFVGKHATWVPLHNIYCSCEWVQETFVFRKWLSVCGRVNSTLGSYSCGRCFPSSNCNENDKVFCTTCDLIPHEVHWLSIEKKGALQSASTSQTLTSKILCLGQILVHLDKYYIPPYIPSNAISISIV